MASFNLDNYEPVADRLARAHEEHPDLRVITDLIHVERSPDGKPIQYIARAQIYTGDILKAQDFAEEIVGSSPVNRTSALENCITSAIGRALADMGYQGSSNGKKQRPSREEMQKVQNAEEPPKVVSATPEQIDMAIEAIGQVAGIDNVNELKMFYSGAKEAGLLTVTVNGTNLNAAISTRKKELEAVK